MGDNIYVGSNSNLAPGVKIAHNTLVGLGSVVNKCYEENFTILAGNPTVAVKKQVDRRENW